jgi:quinol monooxygenase YgiN
MNTIETYAKFSIHEGKLNEFKDRVNAIVQAVRDEDPGTLRYDWYIHEDSMEAIAMDAYLTEKAMYAHQQNCKDLHLAVRGCSDMAVEFLGMPSPQGVEAVTKFGPKLLSFGGGLKDSTGALDFSPYFCLPYSGCIEIMTRFVVEPGKMDIFRRTATELLDVVREKDPGTFRYDWFYNEADNECIAMDTYIDAPGMFAHMKNAHEKHSELMEYSTLITEFLGDLPDEAMAAVGKYNPKIFKYFDGMAS